MKAFLLSALIIGLATSCGSTQSPSPRMDGQTVDAAGHADTQAPTVTMVMFPQTLREAGNVFFQLSTRDNTDVAQVVMTIDGKAFVQDRSAHNSYAKYFTALDNGSHTVAVQVSDGAGNVTEYAQDFQVSIGE